MGDEAEFFQRVDKISSTPSFATLSNDNRTSLEKQKCLMSRYWRTSPRGHDPNEEYAEGLQVVKGTGIIMVLVAFVIIIGTYRPLDAIIFFILYFLLIFAITFRVYGMANYSIDGFGGTRKVLEQITLTKGERDEVNRIFDRPWQSISEHRWFPALPDDIRNDLKVAMEQDIIQGVRPEIKEADNIIEKFRMNMGYVGMFMFMTFMFVVVQFFGLIASIFIQNC